MTLTPLFVVFVASAAVEIILGVVAYSVSFRAKWVFGRHLGGLSLTGGVYTLGNAFSFALGVPDDLILRWTGALNWLMAGLHVSVWVYHCHAQLGSPPARWVQYLSATSIALGVLGLVPDLCVGSKVVVRNTPVGIVTTPELTDVAQLMGAVWVAIMASVFYFYVKAAWRGSSRAMEHAAALGVFFMTVLHEFALSFGIMHGMTSIQFGFAVVVFVVLRDVIIQLLADSDALVALSASLSEKVNSQARHLVESKEQLLRAERLSALGMLATNVGRELNDPLAVILASSHWLKERLTKSDPNDIGGAVEDILQATDRADRIVRDLQVFVRETDEPRTSSSNVTEVIERSLRLVSAELRRAAHVNWTPTTVPEAAIDPQQLTQALVNVLVHACHAFPERRAASTEARIEIRVFEHGGDIQVLVDVSGDSATANAERRALDSTASEATGPNAAATGNSLGLYVAHGILSDAGGSIESEPHPAGLGSRLRIVLPVHGSARASRSPSTSGRQIIARVLVVDPDLGFTKAVGRALAGFTVTTLADPRDARSTLVSRPHEFDVVVCGLAMPTMSGAELYRSAVAAAPRFLHRFLFLKTPELAIDDEAFAAAHADATLDKRVAPHVLRERVTAVAMRGAHTSAPPVAAS